MFTPRLETLWDRPCRSAILLASGILVLAIAMVDWWRKPFSLSFLY